jgi:ferredoxin-nitrite reductase
MQTRNPQDWKKEIPEFREMTEKFYAGEVPANAYKSFSGRYGSYAQKGGKTNMLRLRMTAGRATKEKLAFTAKAIREEAIQTVHFTTCQTIQLHNLNPQQVYRVMEGALDAGIVTMGGGGDFPRNVMCSPLSGVEQGEYFDVLPYAEVAGEYLMRFINDEKMPRKLKVGFSNSPKNLPHATFRDLGFVARPDGCFDVYSAGGLGNNPRLGVKVADAVEKEEILYHIKAMWLTFRAYGNYENRAKARTRYMQESLGGEENYRNAYLEKLKEVMESGENLSVFAENITVTKTGDGTTAEGPRVIPQKQEGLYAVHWHPIGGQPAAENLCALNDLLQTIADAELRLAPDESAYIVNLTGAEAREVLAATRDSAQTVFEQSVSCIGASICQVGLRDSQALLRTCVKRVREAKISEDALPQIHISGCPSSCGTHQIGTIGFRGAVKRVGGKPQPAFLLYQNGCDRQGNEVMGRELGSILETEIPDFVVKLGRTVSDSGMSFAEWNRANPCGVETIAAPYLAEKEQ